MVDQEAVRFMIGFTVLAKTLTDGFTLFAGIGEDETFSSHGVFKDIANAGIGIFRCRVADFFHRRRLL